MPNNNNIDERIVEMRIDNRQFVDGAEKTISVLDRLKKALSFKDAGDGFDDIQKSADKIDLSGMAADVEAISERFSTMGLVGMNVIKNLTDTVTNFITNTVRGLTIDPITTGFQKYEDTARSTATILAATRTEIDKFGSWGTAAGNGQFATQLEYVKNGLEALTWYADETSASMTDMVSNIGKFTNAGVKFENAVTEMMGVTNWGYQAGANKAEQARAMYNLSQAIATGSVKLMDWRSIENANMATIEFKQTVLDTAIQMGALKKESNGTIKTMSGLEVTATNFSETLKEGWFTGGVLEQTLLKYGEYSRRLNAALSDSGLKNFGYTAADVMEAVDRIQDTTDDYSIQQWHDDLAKVMGDEAPTVENLAYQYELLTDKEVDLSRRAFLAGQEYRTFADVIDAVSDAVSSGWMKTFELIIGDTEQAKKVWTALGDELNDIFASSAATRNAILSLWNDPNQEHGLGEGIVSGRDSLINAIATLYKSVRTYIDPVIDAFKEVFKLGDNTKDVARKLLDLTYRFEEWTGKVALSDKAVAGMTKAFTALFTWVKKALGIFKPFIAFVGKGISYLKKLFEMFFESFDTEEGFFDFNYFKTQFTETFGTVGEIIGNVWDKIKGVFNYVKNLPGIGSAFSWIEDKLGTIFGFVTDTTGAAGKVGDKIGEITEKLQPTESLFSKISGWISNINIDTGKLRELFGKLGEIIGTVYEGIVGDPEAFKEKIATLVRNIIDGAKKGLSELKVSDVIEGAKTGTMLYVALQFAQFVKSFKDSAKKFESIPEAITGTFNSLRDTIKSYGKAKTADTMIKMAAAIALLAVAMVALSFVPEDKLASVTVTMAVLFAVLAKIAKNFSKMGDQFSNNHHNLVVKVLPEFAANVIALAILLGVAVGVLSKIGKMSNDELSKGLIGIFIILALVVASIIAMSYGLKEGVDLKLLGKLISVALVIKAAGDAMSKLKDMSWKQIAAAGAVLAGIVLALVAATSLLQGSGVGSGVGSVMSLLSMVITLYALVPLLLGINKMIESGKGESLLKSIGLLALVAVAIAGFAAIMAWVGKSSGALRGAAMLLMIGVAMVAFAAALTIAVPAILALFTGLIGIMVLINENADKTDGALVVLTALSLIMVIAGAGAMMLGKGMMQAGIGFAAFAAGALLIAAAIALLTVVLVPFGQVLIDFCQMIADNGALLVSVVGVIIAGIIGAVMASRLNIAYSLIAIILTVIAVIHQYGPQILQILAVIAEDLLKFIIKLVPMFIEFLVLAAVSIINGTADSIRRNSGAIISAVENLISVVLELFLLAVPRLLGDVFGGLLGMIADAIGLDGHEASDALSGWFTSLGERAADQVNHAFGGAERATENSMDSLLDGFHKAFVEDGEDKITGAITGVGDRVEESLPEIFNPIGEEGGSSFTGSFFDSAVANANDSGNKLDPMRKMLVDKLDLSSESTTDGENFIIGFGNGAISESPWATGVMGNLSISMLEAFENPLGIASPSKAAYQDALFFVQGLINGFSAGEGDAASASETLAEQMSAAVQNALTTVSALADEDFAISPTITPVVDMTNVDAAAGSMSGMFASGAASRISQISRNMADIDRLAGAVRQVTDNKNNISKDYYEVNIYTQPGMDEEEVADLVLYRLSNGIVRKGAALG